MWSATPFEYNSGGDALPPVTIQKKEVSNLVCSSILQLLSECGSKPCNLQSLGTSMH